MPGGNALILSLLGISLYLLSRQTFSRHRVGDMAAYGCAMTAITISLLGLNRPISGLMSVSLSTAVYGVLSGFSLLFIDLEFHRKYRPVQYLAFTAGSIAPLAFIGHIYEMYGLTSYTGMTGLTSVFGPGLGILCARPNVRWKCNGACRYGRIGYGRGARWAGIAHELNQPLVGCGGLAERPLTSLKNPDIIGRHSGFNNDSPNAYQPYNQQNLWYLCINIFCN